jgi:hypothetical protein
VCACVCVCVRVCVAVISLGGNSIGAKGATAMQAALNGISSLTSLEYVIQVWVVCMMGRGQAEWCDGTCCASWCVRRGL